VHLRPRPVGFAAAVFERVVEHAPQPRRRAGARAAARALGGLRQLGDHSHRGFHEHRLEGEAVEIDEHRLAADQARLGHRQRRGHALDARDGNQGRRGVDSFGHVESRRHGVALLIGVARRRHGVDFHQPHLAGPVQ